MAGIVTERSPSLAAKSWIVRMHAVLTMDRAHGKTRMTFLPGAAAEKLSNHCFRSTLYARMQGCAPARKEIDK